MKLLMEIFFLYKFWKSFVYFAKKQRLWGKGKPCPIKRKSFVVLLMNLENGIRFLLTCFEKLFDFGQFWDTLTTSTTICTRFRNICIGWWISFDIPWFLSLLNLFDFISEFSFSNHLLDLDYIICPCLSKFAISSHKSSLKPDPFSESILGGLTKNKKDGAW